MVAAVVNSEVRCASSVLEVPDFHEGLEDSIRVVGDKIAYDDLENFARLLQDAVGEIRSGRFKAIHEARDFVFDQVLCEML